MKKKREKKKTPHSRHERKKENKCLRHEEKKRDSPCPK
jgi:hypothetical protein